MITNLASTTRRQFLCAAAALAGRPAFGSSRRPNILFAISDDQSWLHTGASGDRVVKTPGFDRVAARGVRFTNAICCSPGCAPSRASILTGMPTWQLEEAGTHASYFPVRFQVFPDLLEAAGYHVGFTRKGAGPCNWQGAGRKRNPAGNEFSSIKLQQRPPGVSETDYAANFADFLSKRPKGHPFCFWYGASEPHRDYVPGSGLKSGKKLEDVLVPPFLPDVPEVRSDILDYYTEIEHFDNHLERMLAHLERTGDLENTIVVVTSDNGMAFPHAKACVSEYGIHLPLAIMWPDVVKGGRVVEDLISFLDFAPTFLEAAGLNPTTEMIGRSLGPVLRSHRSGWIEPARRSALSGRERHSHARFDNLGYPSRAVRTPDYLYVRNFKPDLWPAGDPDWYYDIDDSPTKTYMLQHADHPSVQSLFEAGFGKHPAEELFDIRKDPGCLTNLAGQPEFEKVRKELKAELEGALTAQKDPRMLGAGDIFDSYPRFSPMREHLGGFATADSYNPKYRP
ncbi:MAG: sulfatase [Acidobacteriota bacterium]